MEFGSACTGCVRGSKSVRELVSTAAESSGVYGFIVLSGLSRDSSCRKPLEEKTCISHHLHYLKQVKNCCTILVEFVMLFELVMLPFIWMAVSSGKLRRRELLSVSDMQAMAIFPGGSTCNCTHKCISRKTVLSILASFSHDREWKPSTALFSYCTGRGCRKAHRPLVTQLLRVNWLTRFRGTSVEEVLVKQTLK